MLTPFIEVQKHIAFLRSSGFHRDPRVFGDRCSVFEGEMRRRIWATSMELELQASIDKGNIAIQKDSLIVSNCYSRLPLRSV